MSEMREEEVNETKSLNYPCPESDRVSTGLDSFSTAHEGPYGVIRSGWMHVGGGLVYMETIPSGSTATLRLKAVGEAQVQQFELTAGIWRFRYSNGRFQTE